MTNAKEKQLQRKCIVTGQTKSQHELIRFVLAPDKTVIPDLKANLPGRGVWVTTQKSSVEEAVKRKLFQRHFETNCKVSLEIEAQIADLLKKAALGRLKIANKAGLAIYGFTKLMAALEKQTIIALIHAKEASKPEAEKLDYKFGATLETKIGSNSEKSGVLEQRLCKKPFYSFKTQELSLAFGAANVIHAGLKEGGAATMAVKAMQKHLAYSDEKRELD